MHAVVSDDNLQKVRYILLPSIEFLWKHKLENSGVFTPQIPLFPNNILEIASVLPSGLISQHGILGLQKPKEEATSGPREAAGGCTAAAV